MVNANDNPSISTYATEDTLHGNFTFQDKISGPVSYLRENGLFLNVEVSVYVNPVFTSVMPFRF